MTTFTPTSTLAGISHAVASESSSTTINTLSPSPVAVVDFFHGVLRAQGSDTTFTTVAPWRVTFASTNVSTVATNDRVYAIDPDGRLLFGDVTGVSGGQVTVSGWYQNELAPILSTIGPSEGSRTVINVKPRQLSYTIGATVYVPTGRYFYTISDSITFNAHVVLSNPRYAATYRWDMGDGTILTGQEVTYKFVSPSNFRRVVLTVTDDQGHEYVVGQQISQATIPLLNQLGQTTESDLAQSVSPIKIVYTGDNFSTDTSGHFLLAYRQFDGGFGGTDFITPTVSGGMLSVASNYAADSSDAYLYDDRSLKTGDVTVKIQMISSTWAPTAQPELALGYQIGDKLGLTGFIRSDGAAFLGRLGDGSALAFVGGWPTPTANQWLELSRVGNTVTMNLYDTNGTTVLRTMNATLPNSNIIGVSPPTNWQTRLGSGTSGYIAIGAGATGGGHTTGTINFDNLTVT